MSVLRIEVDPNNILTKDLSRLERQALPIASAEAANATAVEIRGTWARTAPKVFDRPTQMTIRAQQFEKATATKPYAVVKLRDEAFKGTPPAKYLVAEVEGGTRARKGMERLLQARGALPTGFFAVAGKGASLDPHGNIKASQVSQILSQLGARVDPYQNETEASRKRQRRREAKQGRRKVFALQQKRGRLLPGVYERLTTGFGSAIRSIFIFVPQVQYKPRYDIFGLAQRTWIRVMPFHFARELEKAVQTLKLGGRR